jgi:hypothetical protein
MIGESTWPWVMKPSRYRPVQVARVECQAVTPGSPDTRCAPILRTQLMPDADVYCRRQDPRPSATRPSARAHHRRLLKSGGRGSLRRAPSSRPSRRGFGSSPRIWISVVPASPIQDLLCRRRTLPVSRRPRRTAPSRLHGPRRGVCRLAALAARRVLAISDLPRLVRAPRDAHLRATVHRRAVPVGHLWASRALADGGLSMDGGEQRTGRRLQVPLGIAPGKPTLQVSTSVALPGMLPRLPLRVRSLPTTQDGGWVQLEMLMSTLKSG